MVLYVGVHGSGGIDKCEVGRADVSSLPLSPTVLITLIQVLSSFSPVSLVLYSFS